VDVERRRKKASTKKRMASFNRVIAGGSGAGVGNGGQAVVADPLLLGGRQEVGLLAVGLGADARTVNSIPVGLGPYSGSGSATVFNGTGFQMQDIALDPVGGPGQPSLGAPDFAPEVIVGSRLVDIADLGNTVQLYPTEGTPSKPALVYNDVSAGVVEANYAAQYSGGSVPYAQEVRHVRPVDTAYVNFYHYASGGVNPVSSILVNDVNGVGDQTPGWFLNWIGDPTWSDSNGIPYGPYQAGAMYTFCTKQGLSYGNLNNYTNLGPNYGPAMGTSGGQGNVSSPQTYPPMDVGQGCGGTIFAFDLERLFPDDQAMSSNLCSTAYQTNAGTKSVFRGGCMYTVKLLCQPINQCIPLDGSSLTTQALLPAVVEQLQIGSPDTPEGLAMGEITNPGPDKCYPNMTHRRCVRWLTSNDFAYALGCNASGDQANVLPPSAPFFSQSLGTTRPLLPNTRTGVLGLDVLLVPVQALRLRVPYCDVGGGQAYCPLLQPFVWGVNGTASPLSANLNPDLSAGEPSRYCRTLNAGSNGSTPVVPSVIQNEVNVIGVVPGAPARWTTQSVVAPVAPVSSVGLPFLLPWDWLNGALDKGEVGVNPFAIASPVRTQYVNLAPEQHNFTQMTFMPTGTSTYPPVSPYGLGPGTAPANQPYQPTDVTNITRIPLVGPIVSIDALFTANVYGYALPPYKLVWEIKRHMLPSGASYWGVSDQGGSYDLARYDGL